jgi:sugar phosphate isomerase/epimerase
MLPEIVAQFEHPSRLCLENLFYPFAWCEPFLEKYQLGVCLDAGHLTLTGGNVAGHFRQYADRIRVIHLHGTQGGRDHLPLTVMPNGWLREFLNLIDKFAGVLTLELFNYESVRDSIVCLNQLPP